MTTEPDSGPRGLRPEASPGAASTEPNGTTLELRHVSKVFAGSFALNDVSLTLTAGRVTALLGANGSGKSTLIKILAGFHTPEKGAEIYVCGQALSTGAPRASHDAGLRFIHQDLGLVDELSVAENMRLISDGPGFGWISNRKERRDIRTLLAEYKLSIDPAQSAASLSPSQRSMLAIIRAVQGGLDRGGVLVLDEPTASLPADEVKLLMDLIRQLRDRGVAILYVSHRLPEVLAIADDVCVLRDGKLVAQRPLAGLSHDLLVELILGRPLDATMVRDDAIGPGTGSLLSIVGIRGGTVRRADIEVAAGEIVGITGVIGSGYESVLGLAFGAHRRAGGRVVLDGAEVPAQPALAIGCGLGYVPPERRLGVIPAWTVRENLTLPKIRSTGIAGWMTSRAERIEADEWVKRLAVTPADPETAFMNLSGGNQQKVIIARWLRCGARALLIDEPTLGVDAGAKRAIHDELRGAAAGGASVLVASSDLEELCELCDRILVMGNGHIVTELGSTADPDRLFSETLRAADAGQPVP